MTDGEGNSNDGVLFGANVGCPRIVLDFVGNYRPSAVALEDKTLVVPVPVELQYPIAIESLIRTAVSMLGAQPQGKDAWLFDLDEYEMVWAGAFNPVFDQKQYMPSTAMLALVIRLVRGLKLYDLTNMSGYLKMLNNINEPFDFDAKTGKSNITEVRNYYEDYRS